MARWLVCRDFCRFTFCNFVFLYFVFIIFDPHSAACRGGGGGDRWHHGRCAGIFVFLYFVIMSFCILYLLYLTHILQPAEEEEEEEGTGGTMAGVQGMPRPRGTIRAAATTSSTI